MPQRKRERDRMHLYTIAMPPNMMDRIKECAAEDDIAIRLWIRESIETALKFQERRREQQREQVSA